MLVMVLLLISAVSWTTVYIDCIRVGFRDKTYCMPLWALGLNICWELIYALNGISNPSVQSLANAVWACCDIVIVATYFRYGREKLPQGLRQYFVPYSVLTFASCIVLQLAFFLHCDSYIQAAQYSAFAQNVAMSVLFVIMLFRRGNTEGQTMLIAVAKWLGTLAPTIQQGIVDEFNLYIILTGALCSVWDILYIVLLWRRKQAEQKEKC